MLCSACSENLVIILLFHWTMMHQALCWFWCRLLITIISVTYWFPDRVDGGKEVAVPGDRRPEGEDREAAGGWAQPQEPDLLRGHQVILLSFHLNLFPIIIQSELRGRGGWHCRLHLLNTWLTRTRETWHGETKTRWPRYELDCDSWSALFFRHSLDRVTK